ncbi:uncharacterized protein GIQ15_05155 [Arthroderma uncinatum]|uniref:uncharacterized protein n=1 Tax=Arthroderma uncinatum TaxID=74035 RepID=UPI00144A7761|nr:uncharacterized protein GIQ15_05155 [Arthroderma uncinatum]KAF3482396.1 hypothetical protein GIQ15_05155 [Arthroderma uncinatum]
MMLSWLAGSNQDFAGGAADESKIIDAPETPAPVFAYRAFKNAMLGTPVAEVDEDKDLTIPIRQLNPNLHRRDDGLKKAAQKHSMDENRKIEIPRLEPKQQEPTQPVVSPSKSILLTPGTAATRRKTVSFGAGVKDNERKPVIFNDGPDLELSGGNISRQWSMNVSGGSGRRSKLTQSLLEAREEKFGQEVDGLDDVSRPKKEERQDTWDMELEDHHDSDQSQEDEEDVTTNLEAPHSQSGKYWKSEFENYRTKTEKEIRKLIEYRSVAKSYAKKKETEALRLTEKLKQEESKVAEMERRVSELAAGMVGGANGENSNKDQMFRELSRQTAAALQYKQKAATFRKTLEDHGVVDNNKQPQLEDLSPDETTQKLREVESALREANAQLRESSGNSKLNELQELVRSSERKAAELKRENLLLQRNLDRVKTELLHVGERRKAQEERAKQREERLESRAQDYSKRLTDSLRDHQAAEEALKKSFDVERKQMQETIDLLKGALSTGGYLRSDNTQTQAHTRSTGPEESTREIFQRLKEETKRDHQARVDSCGSEDGEPEITLDSYKEELKSPTGSPTKSSTKPREPAHRAVPESPFDDETIGAFLKSLRGDSSSPKKQSTQHRTASQYILDEIEATDSVLSANIRRKLQLEPDSRIPSKHSKNSNEPLNLAEELFIRLGGSARNLESLRQKDADMTNTSLVSAPTVTADMKSTPISKLTSKPRTSYRPGYSPRPSLMYLNAGRVDTHPKRPKARTVSQPARQKAINTASDTNRPPSTRPDGPAHSKLDSIPSDRLAAAKARLKQRQLNAKVDAEDKENMLAV